MPWVLVNSLQTCSILALIHDGNLIVYVPIFVYPLHNVAMESNMVIFTVLGTILLPASANLIALVGTLSLRGLSGSGRVWVVKDSRMTMSRLI